MNDRENRSRPTTSAEKGQSKLLDPTPQRKKFVIESLFKFFTGDVTYAQLVGIPQKKLFQIAELGHIKMTYGRVEEAREIFECLVKIDPRNFYYHSVLGTVYQKQKRFVEAVFEYTEALRYKDDDLSSLVNRGEIYLIHKNYRKAAEDFKTAIIKDPVGRSNYANRARSLVIAIKQTLQHQKQQKAQASSAASKPPALASRSPIAPKR